MNYKTIIVNIILFTLYTIILLTYKSSFQKVLDQKIKDDLPKPLNFDETCVGENTNNCVKEYTNFKKK